MTEKQIEALRYLCDRYGVMFRTGDYERVFDLPEGYYAGWIGGIVGRCIYVGVSPEGEVSS